MKKLLLSLILLTVLVGNVFAAEFVHYSQGQKIYIACQHRQTLLPVGEYQYVTTRISVRNYHGDARIEYIEYYGVDPYSGELLPPVKLDLILSPPPNPTDESFDLPPWRSWFWFTRHFFGPPTVQYVARADPFFIVKWVSTNGRRIAAPSFGASLTIQEGPDFATSRMRAVIPFDVKILEELWYWW